MWVWTAATLALVVVAALLWRGSDAAATDSRTAAPAGVPEGTPAAAVSEVWSEDADPLPADVVESGRVIVGSARGVHALDPESGDEVWHYTRSNARLCGLTAVNGVVVAVFRTANRCDEALALHAGTGVRAWTRNVNFRADVVLTSTDRIVLASSPTGVATLDPTGNTLRWRYAPPEGCLIEDAAAGSAGVAVLQTCDGSDAPQLRLLDGFEGSAHWQRDVPAPQGTDIRLLGADQVLGVAVGDELRAVAGEDGALLRRLPLSGSEPRQLAAGGVVLVWDDGTLTALDPAGATELWRTPARGLPSAPVAVEPSPTPLLVPEDDGFVQRDPLSGAQLGVSAAADLPEGGTASSVDPVVVYRLPDRVLAYR